MPTENQHSQSHSHRPSLGGHRSNSSIHSQQTDSPSSTPPHHGKLKPQKHVVGGGGRIHARVPSTKSMHAALKAHPKASSHDNLKKLGRNASTTHIKKNSSHVSLKRNQSSSDVGKRAKSPHANPNKKASAVHFEIGDHDVEQDPEEVDDGDGWEEASSTASPALSRSASRPNSAKHSANNSEPQSPRTTNSLKTQINTSTIANTDGQVEREKDKERDKEKEKEKERRVADAKVITERLLQRAPSHNTTMMSLATATPAKMTSTQRSPGHPPNSDGLANSNGTSQYGSKDEIVSRFVSGSGTPRDAQTFLHAQDSSPSKAQNQTQDDMKRAQSMGNLRTRRDSSPESSQEERRSLAPITRSRKSSIANAYTPPHTQSRTNQKLWLQRASSNIEPQNLAPPASLGITALGLGYAHAQSGVSGLVGSGVGYDGRDPRIKAQLERTGLEYLVVRRHQDPVGAALKRLERLPGTERYRRIPGGGKGKEKERDGGSLGRRSGLGLSQSLKDSRKSGTDSAKGSSYGSHGDRGGGGDDDGVSAILRSLWEKNFDLSSSAD
jgi:hypothetical protein